MAKRDTNNSFKSGDIPTGIGGTLKAGRPTQDPGNSDNSIGGQITSQFGILAPGETEAEMNATARLIVKAVTPEIKKGMQELRRDEIAAQLVGSLIEGNHPANDDTIRTAFAMTDRIREIGEETAKK